ncbi:MAG: M48 family metallopeptidase [Pseudomonadota bacterium]
MPSMWERLSDMVTALERYARLEAEGVWFDGRSARPNPVIVRFGEATLTLSGADDVPRAHWALASLRALPDQGDAKRLMLVPAQDSDERLVVEDAEMISAIHAVCPDLKRIRVPRGSFRRLFLWGGGAVAAVLLIVFVIVPALAERLAVMIPPAQEEALGDQVLAQAKRVFGRFSSGVRVCERPEGLAALDSMVARLEPHFESHVPIKVQIFDHPMVNAFAMPGGHVVLMRGLIERAENAEEVAAVVAHEIGHVMHRDPTRLTLRSAGSAGILSLLIGDVLGGTAIALMTDAVINASYSRAAEAEADRAAHRIMSDAELPLEPMAGFFERLAEGAGDRNGLLSPLATHPDLAGRAEAARKADIIGDTRYVPILTQSAWLDLRQICRR